MCGNEVFLVCKKMKVLLSLALSLSIMLCCLIVASAQVPDSNVVAPFATYITTTNATLDVGTLYADVYGSMTGNTNVTKVKVKLNLQKNSDGVYETVETWEKTFNSRTGYITDSKLISPFSDYRLKATFTAYSGENSETKTLYVYE